MDKVQVLHHFRELYAELNMILCEFDPYGLSDKGEIADEFEEEAWQILYGLVDVHNLDEAIDLVTYVFVKAFDAQAFNKENCTGVATRIYAWWLSK
ncbi:hypothetical protein [Paenibacillus sp. WLX2291]|uniref:hypothetical protein n=1 Tax=Paenibacillus sp. WLX2291 TaxID=3296934 RepID=UPI0039841A13